LNQGDINHLNRAITHNEIEAAIVSQKRKVQDLMDSLLKSIRLRKTTEGRKIFCAHGTEIEKSTLKFIWKHKRP
jgi:hypothetical protein